MKGTKQIMKLHCITLCVALWETLQPSRFRRMRRVTSILTDHMSIAWLMEFLNMVVHEGQSLNL